jgi:tripartite-type tricarboxylate transporter receptor subunit TctC
MVERDPKFAEFLEKQAVQPAPSTPAEFAAFLKKDRQDAESLIKLSNQPRTNTSRSKPAPRTRR